MKYNVKRRLRKRIVLITAVFLLIIVVAGVWATNIPKSKVTNVSTSQTKPAVMVKKPSVIHVAALGDMLAHDTIIANATTETSYNFKPFFQNIRSSYADSDVIFCNQEGLSSGEKYGIAGYPSFNAPTQFAVGLQVGAGCNVINLANNHMGDRGAAATNDTIDEWTTLKPFAFAGANKSAADQNKVSYFTLNGIKVAFLAFADFNNNGSTPSYSVNIYHNEALVRSLVAEARANADFVMVSMHWGVEDSNTVSTDQYNQVNLLSSLGVDVIIGTGPHVLQKVETVKRPDGGSMVVWYSLGNMLSSQLLTKELIGGIAKFDVTKADNGTITVSNLTFIPTYMHYEWTAAQRAAGDLLARHNAMIYLLKDASAPLSRSLLGTTVAEQKQYVIDTLGPQVAVE